MESQAFEKAGAIPMPQPGQYVVHMENLPDVISLALEKNSQVSIIGKTSANQGAALVISVTQMPASEKHVEEFFAKPPNRAGLSKALLDVVDRRS
jgi:hypothetical protein